MYRSVGIIMFSTARVCIVACPNNTVSIADYQKDLMHDLGFESKEQFIEAYPGKFDIDSPVCSKIPAYKNYYTMHTYAGTDIFDSIFFLYQPVYDDTYDTALQKLMKLIKASMKKERGAIFTVKPPTLAEIKTVPEFEGCGADDLWFCSDWKG